MRLLLIVPLLALPLAGRPLAKRKPRPTVSGPAERPYIMNLRARARRGQAKAQFDLGVCYRFAQGVPRDDAEAVKWYRMAAEQDYDKAQYNLGVCYDFGTGVPKDHEEAVKWYRKAAQQGHTKAAHNLAVDYKYGQGVPRDDAEAYAWFDLAAVRGEALAVAARDDLARTFTPETLQRAKGRSLALQVEIAPKKPELPSPRKSRKGP